MSKTEPPRTPQRRLRSSQNETMGLISERTMQGHKRLDQFQRHEEYREQNGHERKLKT